MAEDNGSSPMEIEAAFAAEPIKPRFTIDVLVLLKTAQMQHGLRHGDYLRYRRYCTSRLRRLYKSLKFKHGHGKFTRRNITEATVTDVRYLHIVMYMAERAWSNAMEKRQLPDGPNAKQRIYLLAKLRKAVKWATLFAQLCAAKCDPRTSLEAESYASYMKGTLHFEQDQNWKTALTNFRNASAVYEELGKYGSVKNQLLCRERVDELEPTIRYCLHKAGESKLETAELFNIGEMEGPALDLFKSKLEAVLTEARSQEATSMTEFQWLGRRFPINNAKTRMSILKAQGLEKDLYGSAAASLPAEKKLTIFEKIIAAYADSGNSIRNDLASAGNAESSRDDLTGLDKAVSAVKKQRMIERDQLYATILKNKLPKHQDDRSEKVTRSEELVHLYYLLIQNITELSDLVSSGRDINSEEAAFSNYCILRGLMFRAERCFYLAKSYSSAGKKTEAYALFCHARSLADSAIQKLKMTTDSDKAMLDELKGLSDYCRSCSCIEHALVAKELEKIPAKLSEGVSAMSLNADKKEERYLLEMLSDFESALSSPSSKAPPRIDRFPPPFQSVSCNPIVLDISYDSIHFPSLENRMKKERKGFLGRLWG